MSNLDHDGVMMALPRGQYISLKETRLSTTGKKNPDPAYKLSLSKVKDKDDHASVGFFLYTNTINYRKTIDSSINYRR